MAAKRTEIEDYSGLDRYIAPLSSIDFANGAGAAANSVGWRSLLEHTEAVARQGFCATQRRGPTTHTTCTFNIGNQEAPLRTLTGLDIMIAICVICVVVAMVLYLLPRQRR